MATPKTFYQFLDESSEAGAYFIQQTEVGWTLWYLGKGGHLSLHDPETIKEVGFDTAEAVMEYCGQATDDDPRWRYFRERIFRGRESMEFPVNLGDGRHWVKGTDSQ